MSAFGTLMGFTRNYHHILREERRIFTRLSIVLGILVVIFVLRSDSQPRELTTNTDWSAFLKQFRAAVEVRDSPRLSNLMVKNFDTGHMFPSSQAFLKAIDWVQLGRTIQREIKPCTYKRPGVKLAYCAMDPHPCPKCSYQMFLSFEKGADDQWRWASMVASGD